MMVYVEMFQYCPVFAYEFVTEYMVETCCDE